MGTAKLKSGTAKLKWGPKWGLQMGTAKLKSGTAKRDREMDRKTETSVFISQTSFVVHLFSFAEPSWSTSAGVICGGHLRGSLWGHFGVTKSMYMYMWGHQIHL